MKFSDKLQEECAVFGVSIKTAEAAGVIYNGLLALQHRGQEGCGIAVVNDNNIICQKDVGLVSEVFDGENLSSIPASRVAIGHNRYSTTGGNNECNVQPFITEYLTGRIATAHNGNVTNAKFIKDGLKSFGVNFSASSDSEVVSSLIAYYIMKLGDELEGVIKAASLLEGAFSLIVMCGNGKIIAVRDGNGYRPLCIGQNKNGYAVSSESCGLDSCGFTLVRDVLPGEAVVIEDGEITESKVVLEAEKGAGLCIFEYVYFARPDSTIDGLSVYESRFNMGAILAKEHPVVADVVCGVPDSGLEAAIGYSEQSKIPLTSGFVKNRYIGRSFIYPTQAQRENAVRLKLNPLAYNVKGKRVVLVDDSIVRGTTSKKIVQALKNAGATEVHLRISAPPFKYTCNYGTDIDNEESLIANRMTIDEITKEIGADSLGYISVDGLKDACQKSSCKFCTKCFTGNINKQRKSELEG